MNEKTYRVRNVAQAIIVLLILVAAASFYYLGLSAEGLAAVALAISNIASQQANNAERRVRACLQSNDELIQALEKIQQANGCLKGSKAEASGSGGLDERS